MSNLNEGIAVLIDKRGVYDICIKEGRVSFSEYADLVDELTESLIDLDDAVVDKVKMITDAKRDVKSLMLELETGQK